MIDMDYASLMAQYNAWMNGKLYHAATRLTDVQRKEDRGAFFKSIHGTLNHLIFADLAWLYRFTGRPLDGLNPGADLYADFAQLHARRVSLDAELLAWAETLTPAWLAADFSYYSMAYKASYTRPAWTLVVHLFNHQTHHRGQATTLLTQAGIDIGATDLPALPALAYTPG